jgi:hypothetical protein
MQPATRADLRKFGLTVGGVFLVIAGISWWRGHEIPPRVLAACGAALVVPGLVAPGVLGPVHRGWMAFAGVLAHVNTRIILTLLFYVVLTPIGMVMRLFRDPLNRSLDAKSESDWIPRTPQQARLESYERQF